ncbi:MAG: DUF4388 domain-containing protein, partial [Calditrichaceae bacterium]
ADILVNHFNKVEYHTTVLADIPQAMKQVSEEPFLMILVDYEAIVASPRNDVISFFKLLHERNLVVFNVPDNANQRLAFYELGARRVFDQSLELDEVYQSLQLLIKVLEKTTGGDVQYSRGKLEDMSLTSLINSLGKEGRSGILKIVTKYNSGKIYFVNGNIDEAQVGLHSGEQAVLHMLFWRSGNFSFSSSQPERAANKVKLSNFGLLIQAESLRKAYQVNLEEIGPQNSIIHLKNKGDLLSTLSGKDKALVQKIEKPVLLEELLENPVYTCVMTAERLTDFKRKGFLDVKLPAGMVIDQVDISGSAKSSGLKEALLNIEEVNLLKENLGLDEQQTGKLVIPGTTSAVKSSFIRQLSNSKRTEYGESNLDFAHIQLAADLYLMLFGVSMAQMDLEAIEKVSEGLAGYIFLIDAEQNDYFEQANAAINHLISVYNVPWIMVITNLPEGKMPEDIKSQFILPLSAVWVEYTPEEPESLRQILLSLRPLNKIKEEKVVE